MQKLNQLTDEQLVAAYANGSNEAFDALLNRHSDRVYTYILHIVKDSALADDIFQETFVKAITTIKQGRYSESGKFSAWITRIAHNLIIDNFRQEKSENTFSADTDDVDIFNRRDLADGNIEDTLVKEQIHTDVRRIMDSLPDSQREVIDMRFFRDMSFKEIAEATGVSINTALGRMRYAVLNMRRIADKNNIVLTVWKPTARRNPHLVVTKYYCNFVVVMVIRQAPKSRGIETSGQRIGYKRESGENPVQYPLL